MLNKIGELTVPCWRPSSISKDSDDIFVPSEMAFDVKIEDYCSEKEFLGGWKNVITGREYHDGSSQTFPLREKKQETETCIQATSRVVQTLSTLPSNYSILSRDKTTQTSCFPDLTDKVLTMSSGDRNRVSGRMQCEIDKLPSSKEFPRLEESARKIQKFFRACRTRTEITSLARFAVETRIHPPVSEDMPKLSHDNKFEIVGRRAPRTRSDFIMLRHVLDRWRILENERIDRTLFGHSKIAAKAMILLREIELLRLIELAKTQVKEQDRERKSIDCLETLAKPEIWRTRDGKTMEVETLRISRALECRIMYNSLVKVNESRLDTLTCLKSLLLGHTCEKSKELEYLIDQEMSMSLKSIPSTMMSQLRNRIKNTFFHFSLECSQPTKIKVEKVMKFCVRCEKLLPSSNFKNKSRKLLTCERCFSLRPSKDPKILYEPYEQMLKDLRQSECGMGSYEGLAFEIGPEVLHHLVNHIWHGKSGISEFDDLFSLRLLRFRSDLQWSPWNSILLTKREAAIHQAMTNPWELYESSLVKRFVLRNLQAKLCFDSPTNK